MSVDPRLLIVDTRLCPPALAALNFTAAQALVKKRHGIKSPAVTAGASWFKLVRD
jgi:hypothetical protein